MLGIKEDILELKKVEIIDTSIAAGGIYTYDVTTKWGSGSTSYDKHISILVKDTKAGSSSFGYYLHDESVYTIARLDNIIKITNDSGSSQILKIIIK